MTITFDMDDNRNKFTSLHHTHFRTADGFENIVLTGVAIIHLQGESQDSWRREQIELGIRFNGIVPRGKVLALKNWAPFVTLNAVYNANVSHNSGHAVDTFGVLNPSWPLDGKVFIKADIAIRDSDAHLYRLGYQVNLVGKFEDPAILI